MKVDESRPSSVADPLRGLALRVAEGQEDAEAIRTLLRALGPTLLRVARGVLGVSHPDVADVCQEAALRFLSALPGFRWECTVTHFACRVAVLTAMNTRRRARVVHLPYQALEEHEASEPSPAETLAADQRRAALRDLLDELPAAQAEVLALHVMLGHTVPETSSMLSVPIDTVRSRLRRALAALRDRVQGSPALMEVVGGGHD